MKRVMNILGVKGILKRLKGLPRPFNLFSLYMGTGWKGRSVYVYGILRFRIG
jgi:hypothetical protein